MMCAAAEITLATDGIGGRQTWHVATHGFSTAPDDTPANTTFRELLVDPGGPTREMFRGARVTGPIGIDAGTLKLNNAAGDFDDWPADYGTAGGQVVVRWGRIGSAYPAAWDVVYRAQIKSLAVDFDACTLGLRNRLHLLDKPVVTDVFTGTGGIEGTGTTSKRKQLAFDEPGYIPLIPLDLVKQLYFVQANASDVRALAGTFPPYYYVFDGGVALTHGGYYTTAADFANGAAPAAGYFKVWAEGWDTTGASAGNAPGPLYVRLGSPPANDLRIATLGFLMNVGDAPANIRRWKLADLCNRAGLSDITAATMAPRSVNLELGGRLLTGDETYLDVMSDVCKWRHAAVGFTRDDTFFARELLDPLDASDPADTVRYTFTEANARNFRRVPIPGADAPIWQVSVNAGKTWPCQVANGAPAAVREAMQREPWQTSFTGTADAVKAANPGAATAQADIVGNVFVTKADKQAFVDRYLMLHGGRRDFMQLQCTQIDAASLALELGDKVQVLHTRMGCTPARTFRVIRIEPADLVSREPVITFGLWGGAAGPAASVLGGGSSSGSPGGSGQADIAAIGTVSLGEFAQSARSSVSGVMTAAFEQLMGGFIQFCNSTVADPPIVPVLLLHFDGSDGSTTITDSSSYARSGTGNTNCKLSTTRSKFGSASLKVTRYNGGGGVAFGPNADFARSANQPWTAEGWVYIAAAENYTTAPLVFGISDNIGASDRVAVYGNSPIKFAYDNEQFGEPMTPATITTGAWVHVAMVYDGTDAVVWVGGSEFSRVARSFSASTTGTLFVAGSSGGTGADDATEFYLDEVRVVIGQAIYTSAFTPPSAPF